MMLGSGSEKCCWSWGDFSLGRKDFQVYRWMRALRKFSTYYCHLRVQMGWNLDKLCWKHQKSRIRSAIAHNTVIHRTFRNWILDSLPQKRYLKAPIFHIIFPIGIILINKRGGLRKKHSERKTDLWYQICKLKSSGLRTRSFAKHLNIPSLLDLFVSYSSQLVQSDESFWKVFLLIVLKTVAGFRSVQFFVIHNFSFRLSFRKALRNRSFSASNQEHLLNRTWSTNQSQDN